MAFSVTQLRRAERAEAAHAALGREPEVMWECVVVWSANDYHKVDDVVILSERQLVGHR